ncbi:hypothetical protein ACJ41O_014640 [Fusarium nematophilum]
MASLQHAATDDAPNVVAFLLRHGNNAYDDEPAFMPLCLALARTQSCFDHSLDEPLLIAARYRMPRTMRFLLHRGADPNAVDSLGLAALHQIMQRSASDWENPRLDWREEETQAASALLLFGADPNLQSTSCRVQTAGYDHVGSPKCDARGQRALHFAVDTNHYKFVELLLNSGGKPHLPDGHGFLPLHLALERGCHTIVHQLLDYNQKAKNPVIDRNQGRTALHVASRYARNEAVLLLLKRGADVNATDALGQTPLHEALTQKSYKLHDELLKVLEHLVRHGASLEVTTPEGWTALDLACGHPFTRVRKMFRVENRERKFPASTDNGFSKDSPEREIL